MGHRRPEWPWRRRCRSRGAPPTLDDAHARSWPCLNPGGASLRRDVRSARGSMQATACDRWSTGRPVATCPARQSKATLPARLDYDGALEALDLVADEDRPPVERAEATVERAAIRPIAGVRRKSPAVWPNLGRSPRDVEQPAGVEPGADRTGARRNRRGASRRSRSPGRPPGPTTPARLRPWTTPITSG